MLQSLFQQWAGVPCNECLALGGGGGSRRYFRLTSPGRSAIGCIGDDLRENEAFLAFDRHLRDKGIPVPEVYAVSPDRHCYLLQDLGDQTLYCLLFDKQRKGGGFDAQMLALYRQALSDLAQIQQAGADIDFSLAYPRAAFDRQSILWDLNYFKYYFLKLAHAPFDEQLLEDDFDRLADYLLTADTNYFLYRDFNPRNIMLVGSELFYIDFQGGRRGAAQYDVASLLYSAKSNLPEAIRRQLIGHYLDVRGIHSDERRQWMEHFRAYLLVRILQTLGAYGYRGLYERKDYFIQSIPLALNNLAHLTDDGPLPVDVPHILQALSQIPSSSLETQASSPANNSSFLTPHSSLDTESLTVTVMSFSYKQGLPKDTSGNGGGFIFDCRALPNPGRYEQYRPYTGKDRPVIEFLQPLEPVNRFLQHTQALVAQSVEKYLERHFSHLQVAFGCTGGQHRSVYCAEQTARWLSDTYGVNIQIIHREQD